MRYYYFVFMTIFIPLLNSIAQESMEPIASFLGTHSSERVGYHLHTAGDVDGDGYDDFLIGTFHNHENGHNSGAAYLILGRSSANWGHNRSLTNADSRFIGKRKYDAAGYNLGGGGDVNGDGYDDMVIGAPAGDDSVPENPGYVYIVFGRSNPNWGYDFVLQDGADAYYAGENPHDIAGISCAIAGDINGDGFDDILVGVPYNDDVNTDAGKAYLILGKADGWQRNVSLSQAEASFQGQSGNALAGYSVDGVGDVNGDEIPDFVIGARGSKKVYLFFGRRNVDWGRNFSLGNADVTFYSTQWNDWTGWRSAGAGDVNGDGFNDILIGAPKHNQDGGDAGKVFLIFGRSSGWRGDLDDADASFYGEDDNDQAGWDVQGAGDVNGDGYDDFVIGAWYNDQNGEDAGKMYLIEGKSSGWSRDVKLSAIDKYFLGEYAGDYAGFSAATAGDVNGDGVNDIVTSSTYYSRSYSWGGKISLFLGEPNTNLQPELSVNSNQLDFGDDITSLTLTVTNSGNGILEWDCSLQNNSSWITSISPSNGNLGAGMSEVVSITIDRGQLSAGFHNDSLMISSNGGNALVEIYANVPILNELTTSTPVLDYGSTYTNRGILLRNTGNTTLNWSIANTTNISWISSISPNQGILSQSDSINVSVEVNRAGLPAGEYFGNLQLSSEAGTVDLSLKLKVYTTNTLYVRNIKDSPNAWDGKENVYVSINEALETATLGDHIWVAQGEYYESVQLKHGIKLIGGFSGTETSPDERVDLLHNHHYNTIVNSQNVDRCILTASDNIVDGFKLINGYAYRGGGVSIYENSNIELRNLFITECEAEHTGGGIDILAYSGSILIENIIIWKCISICGALEISDLSTAETTVRNCTIVDNNSYGLEVPYHSDITPGTRNHDFYNCIVWENNNSRAPSLYSDVWAWARDFTDYSYIGYGEWSAVSGKWGSPLPNNIFEMNVGGPDFMDAVNGDFRLSPTSPCIGRGRNNEDMGAIPFDGEALPVLSITPASLQFQGIEGQTNPANQTLSVRSSTGDTIQFTVEEVPEMDWLNLSAASGSTEDQIEVSVDISGLNANTYSGSIRLTNGTVLNDVVDIPVELVLSTEPVVSGSVLGAFEAEANPALPLSGWEITTNENQACICAVENSITAPLDQYCLDYYFNVPTGVSSIYVFAEVDVNASGSDDSFWITLNGSEQCEWNNLYRLGDGWQRAWVYDYQNDQQHEFAVQAGQNKLSLFPREAGPFINWLVITTDKNFDIHNYDFSGTPIDDDPVIAVSHSSLSFTAVVNGTNPASQQLIIDNSGGGTLNWNANEQPEESWLSLSKTAGGGGESIDVSVDISSLAEGSYNSSIQITADSASNSPITVPISLTITAEPTGPLYAEFEAELSPELPNSGWEVTVNEGENCLRAVAADVNTPPQQHQLNYKFIVPTGVNTVYVFAEVDVNGENTDDSFWITMNGADACEWNNMAKLGDGWNRSWVYNYRQDNQHAFAVSPGENILNIYPRERNAHINWLVVTENPQTDIINYQFGNVTTPPPVDDDPVIAVSSTSLSYSAVVNGTNPAAKSLVINNSGGGTLNWTASEQPEQTWLSLSKTAGAEGESIDVSVDISALTEGTYSGSIQVAADSATNSPLTVPVSLTVTAEPTGPTIAEFEAEASSNVPNSGWEATVNNGENCLLAIVADINSPPEQYRLNYTFNVPTGVNTVYVFAEVDVNGENTDDSFWITMNGADVCEWNNMAKLGDGWKRSWVYDYRQDNQHAFAVSPGENTLNLYPRERNAYINWLVVTADPDADIANYQFGDASPPPPVEGDPTIAVSSESLSFTAIVNGDNPPAKQIVITNSGGDTLNWTAAEQPEQVWLNLSNSAGVAGESIDVSVDIASLAIGSYSSSIQISADSATNSPVTVPISLSITDEPSGPMYTEFQAEASPSLPNSGWEIVINEGEDCLRANASDISNPPQQYQLNYTFLVPQDVNTVYVFAEVDVNKSGSDDSFWITMNGADPCQWNGLYTLGDGWHRSWIYDYRNDKQHAFAVSAGENTLNLYPREKNAHINWIVVTADKDADIANYQFGSGATPPPPTTNDPLIAVDPKSLSFSAFEKGANPSPLTLSISNAGSGELQWTAAELPDETWLSMDKNSGIAGDQINVSVDISGLGLGDYSTSIHISDPNAENDSVSVPVSLKITTEPEGEIIAIFEVEENPALPNDGWEISVNENEDCLKVLKSSISTPNDIHRLDFSFEVPDGISTVFIFAEVDVNNSYNEDSFWVTLNNSDTCEWNNLKSLGDGWNRAWIYNYRVDQQHEFTVNSGTNVVSLYPREARAHINWVVVTTNPDLDIHNFDIQYNASLSIAGNDLNAVNSAIANDIIPEEYSLHQNYPNPFNPLTTIQFDLPEETHVKFVIYNSLGQRIRLLDDRYYQAGKQFLIWDGRDDRGVPVTSGVYHGVLMTENYRKIVRMIYIK